MTFDSDQMTLTCFSTGGPATTVIWTRDSITVTEGTETVLNNATTAQYTHTLTVTTGGEYTCTVSNNKPSSDSASITVPGIERVQCLYVSTFSLAHREQQSNHAWNPTIQEPHLPVVSESPGLLPLHWEVPQATGSTTLEQEAVVTVWMLMVETLTVSL